jgi:hypothetical protein
MPDGLFTPQTTEDFLESMYGPLGVTSQQYGQYSQFLGEIPEELYTLTDPSAEIYQQFRTEQQGRLSDQLGETYTGLEQSLFQGQREARGMQGRAGLIRGRDFMGEISEQVAMKGQRASSAFGRGLYDIEQDIVDRVGAERRYVAGLEANRRSDALRLAELAGLFDENDAITPQPGPIYTPGAYGINLPDFNFNFDFDYGGTENG